MILSIIVPVYNVKPFLPECLDSLLKQSLSGDYEIILVDDGSTDGAADVISEYQQLYPQKIRSLRVENGGQGRARNFGIEMARGEYLGFVDSDDWLELDMYEKLLERAIRVNADIVVCDFKEKFSDGREGYLYAALQNHRLASAGSSCNKIFRRSLVEEVRFPQGLWYEDFYFSAVMLLKSRRTEFVSEPLYVYRKGQESTMHNNNARKNLDMIKIMDMLAEYMLPRELNDDFAFLMVNHVGIDAINRLAQQDQPDKDVIRQMQRYFRRMLPKLCSSSAFRNESLNRQIISWLNYHGFEKLSQRILRLKASTK